MESVEMALKNSNQKEKTLNGGAQNGEDFSVDDLLNFPNDDVFSENDEAELKVVQPNDENTLHRNNDFSTAGEDLGSLPTSGLAVPMGDLAELEWLSKFVEETNQYFPTYSADPTKKPDWLTGNRKHPVPPVNEDSAVKPPLPIETRSERARTGVRVWTDSSSGSATSSSSSSGPSSSNALCLSGVEFLDETMVKKQKKTKPLTQIQTLPQTQTETRKCGHCGVQSTPQWRTGPMGAKTLCNACGVRYKSGRLLPEYRPACSPSFSSELHSNHHRKVVEMRLKKVSDDADGTGLNQSV